MGSWPDRLATSGTQPADHHSCLSSATCARRLGVNTFSHASDGAAQNAIDPHYDDDVARSESSSARHAHAMSRNHTRTWEANETKLQQPTTGSQAFSAPIDAHPAAPLPQGPSTPLFHGRSCATATTLIGTYLSRSWTAGLSGLRTLAFYIGTHTYITNEGTLATCLVVMPLVLATHDRGIPPD